MFSKTNLIMKSLKCGKSRHSNIKQRKVDEQTGWWRENGGQRPGVVQPSGVCLHASVCVCALASLVSWYGGENDLDYQDWYQSHTHGHAPTASPAHMLTLSPSLSGAFWFALGSIQSLQLEDSSPSLVCVCVEGSPLIEVYSELAACLMLHSHMKGRERERTRQRKKRERNGRGMHLKGRMDDLLKALMGEKLREKQDRIMGGGSGG